MGTFTALGDRDLRELADAFALGQVVEHAPIAAGTINSNFRVVAETGTYFLRVNEGKSEEDVAYEARLVEAFAAGGIPTPTPIAARDGRRYAPHQGKWVSAFAWRAGGHLAAEDVTPAHASQLGAALARMHVVGLQLPASWQRPSIYDHAHLVARYHEFRGSPDPELAHAIAVLGQELAIAESAQGVRDAATHGIIHGDLFRDNVLWDAGSIVAILDFEQASGGSLPYDLGVCMNDWCWTDDRVQLELVRALLDGYRSVRALPPEDRDALLIEARAAAARFTITRITDVYLARVANPDKDFRAFLARVEAWSGGALGQLSALL